MTDEMPANGQIGQLLGPIPKLLRPALAQCRATGGNHCPNFGGTDIFRHCDQLNFIRSTPRPNGSRFDMLPHSI
jgi:hypothetical protein